MRYGIFSDIHSNLQAFEAVITAYQNEAIDQYLCLGDIVGYAANPKECIEMANSLCRVVIAGNHDWATAGLLPMDSFNDWARQAAMWTQRNINEQERYFLQGLKLTYQTQDLSLTHGTLDNPQYFNYLVDEYIAGKNFELMQANICFLGHTHVAGIFIRDDKGKIRYFKDLLVKIKDSQRYIVNVGSVGQPRDGNPEAAYCVYDTIKQEIRIRRICYDIQSARKKIIENGLPRFLGDRLVIGQ